MRKRFFFAIELPESVKDRLLSIESQFEGFPVRWIEREELRIIIEGAPPSTPFDLEIERFSYHPKREEPRMIWALTKVGQITLARINRRNFDSSELPLLEDELNLSFRVKSLSLVENRVKGGVIGYKTIKKIELR